MRVLYLTSRLGYGHTRAADAIEAALRHRVSDLDSQSLDLWSLMDQRVADSVKDGYLRMTRQHPELYQKLYDLDIDFWRQLSGEERPDATLVGFLSEQQRRWFPEELKRLPGPGRYPDQALFNSFLRLIRANYANPSRKIVLRSLLLLMRIVLLNRLKERIQAFVPDVIVSTQMYPAALVSHLKRRGEFRHTPSFGVVTDYGLQSVWVRPTTDNYCVGCVEVLEQLTRRGVSEQRVHLTGIPLLPQFRHPPDAGTARRTLGIPPDRNCVFVTGGQYGIGMVEAVADLVRSVPGLQILVAAGRAADETDRLKALGQRHGEQIRVFGWVDDMTMLYSAADVVVGKPGGLSVSEALACGRPFFATCSLGGQERHNIGHLERNGVGGAIQTQALAARLSELFAEPGRIRDLQQRALACGHRDGADKIADLICTVHAQRAGRAVAGANPEREEASTDAHTAQDMQRAGRPPGGLRTGDRRVLRGLFLAFDSLYGKWHRLQAVDEFLQIESRPYRGPGRTFDDGTVVRPGDPVAILHFNNDYLREIHERAAQGARTPALAFGIQLIRSMHRLADGFAHDPGLSAVVAITGVTWFKPHGGSIGFHAEPLPAGPRKTLLRLHFRILLAALFPRLAKRENRRLEPHRFWLTRQQLFRTLKEEDNHVVQRLAGRSASRVAL